VLFILPYTRMLKAIGVDVYFEEQGIHSTESGAEFYITIYGCIAQSESENMSANIKLQNPEKYAIMKLSIEASSAKFY
jgi:hypothetical protein